MVFVAEVIGLFGKMGLHLIAVHLVAETRGFALTVHFLADQIFVVAQMVLPLRFVTVHYFHLVAEEMALPLIAVHFVAGMVLPLMAVHSLAEETEFALVTVQSVAEERCVAQEKGFPVVAVHSVADEREVALVIITG